MLREVQFLVASIIGKRRRGLKYEAADTGLYAIHEQVIQTLQGQCSARSLGGQKC